MVQRYYSDEYFQENWDEMLESAEFWLGHNIDPEKELQGYMDCLEGIPLSDDQQKAVKKVLAKKVSEFCTAKLKEDWPRYQTLTAKHGSAFSLEHDEVRHFEFREYQLKVFNDKYGV